MSTAPQALLHLLACFALPKLCFKLAINYASQSAFICSPCNGWEQRPLRATPRQKSQEPGVGRGKAGGSLLEEAKQPQPAASLTSEMWKAGVAAAASKGAGVWWVRERRGKRAEKSGFACTVLSSYSSKSSSRQGGRQPPSNQRDRTKGRQLYMDKVGEKGRAVGKKSCTSQHLWKLQLLQGHLRGNGIAQTRGSDQVRERLHLHRSEQIRGNVICGITELHRSVPLGLSCKSASAGEGCACWGWGGAGVTGEAKRNKRQPVQAHYSLLLWWCYSSFISAWSFFGWAFR